jgi:hypothetical protein
MGETEMTRTIGTVQEVWSGRLRTFKVIRCDCSQEFTLFDSWSNDCDCGRSYNASGQLLAHRSQWGEETGEHFA